MKTSIYAILAVLAVGFASWACSDPANCCRAFAPALCKCDRCPACPCSGGCKCEGQCKKCQDKPGGCKCGKVDVMSPAAE